MIVRSQIKSFQDSAKESDKRPLRVSHNGRREVQLFNEKLHSSKETKSYLLKS